MGRRWTVATVEQGGVPCWGIGRWEVNTRWTRGIVSFLYGWGNGGPGEGEEEERTPGPQGRLESVSQLCSPGRPPPPAAAPWGPLLHSLTTPCPVGSPGAEGAPRGSSGGCCFLSRKPHGHALRAWSCGSSWGGHASTPERRGALLTGKEQRHGTPQQPLHASSKQPGRSEGRGAPTASPVRPPHPDPQLSGPPGPLLAPEGQQHTVMLAGGTPREAGCPGAFPPVPPHPDLLPRILTPIMGS